MLKKIIIGALVLILCLVGLGFVLNGANASEGEPGTGPNNPIWVKSLSDIPSDATLTAVKNKDCSVTTTGVVIRGGFDEVSHMEYRYKRDVPAVEEQSHQEWGVQERTRDSSEVPDYKTQYHFRKFTHTKTGVKHGNTITWGDYGPWTPWEPMTHESWEDANTPLGVPEFHGEGHDGNQYWYREWQAQWDGQTHQVQIGTHTEYGEWSDWETTQDHLLTEPTVPANTDTHEYQVTGPVKVVDVEAQPGYTEYYVEGGEPSLNEADASWILADTLEGWTQFDERKVIDQPSENSYLVWYAYNDGGTCPPPKHHEPPKHHTPPVKHNTPKVPLVIEAGL